VAWERKFRFASKFAKYLHQPVISRGVETCTFFNYLTAMGVWALPPEVKGLGVEPLALGDFWGFTTKIIYF